MEYLQHILPIINASGIPLLLLAMWVVTRAYRHTAEVHKKQADDARAECERLRDQISLLDDSSVRQLERISQISTTALDTIVELQHRKSLLLSTAEEDARSRLSVESEASDIDEIISLVAALSDASETAKLATAETEVVWARNFRSVVLQLGQISDRLTHIPTKLAAIRSFLSAGEQRFLLKATEGRAIGVKHVAKRKTKDSEVKPLMPAAPKPPELKDPVRISLPHA